MIFGGSRSVSLKRAIQWLAFATVSGASVAAFTVFPLGRWLLDLVEWVRSAGAAGVLLFAIAYVGATVLLLPGSILTLGAGFAYGPLLGTLLVSPISVAAATASFLLARFVAREGVARRIERDGRVAAIDRSVGKSGHKVVAHVQNSPNQTLNLLNAAKGLTRVSTRDIGVGSRVGMLPGTLLYVYLGSLVTSASEIASGKRPDAGTWGSVLYWGGLGATVVVTVVVSRIAKRALASTLSPPARSTATPGSKERHA
jgi:uncharacterized membrane protein YdjX (TVP38/TMEM64 family)